MDGDAVPREGGAGPEFNLLPVLLSEADLSRLEEAVRCGYLPQTSGFFFGKSDGSEREDDLAFIAKAREALRRGLTVGYIAWW